MWDLKDEKLHLGVKLLWVKNLLKGQSRRVTRGTLCREAPHRSQHSCQMPELDYLLRSACHNVCAAERWTVHVWKATVEVGATPFLLFPPLFDHHTDADSKCACVGG